MAKLVKKTALADAPAEQFDVLPDARRIADLLSQHKAIDIKGYDLRGLTLVADCFIIASASSEPQFKALFNAVKDGMKEIGVRPLHVEGELTGGWLIIDYSTIVVHVFRETARDFYDLDGLWGDAPMLDLAIDEN